MIMGVEAEEWRDSAKEMLAEFGRATLTPIAREVPGGAYDVDTLDSGTPDAPEVFLVNTAPIDYVGMGQVQGVNVLVSFKQLYIESDGVYVPEIGDIVTLDVPWKINKVLNAYETESTECAYRVELVRS
jgi:hypothetical protein